MSQGMIDVLVALLVEIDPVVVPVAGQPVGDLPDDGGVFLVLHGTPPGQASRNRAGGS